MGVCERGIVCACVSEGVCVHVGGWGGLDCGAGLDCVYLDVCARMWVWNMKTETSVYYHLTRCDI